MRPFYRRLANGSLQELTPEESAPYADGTKRHRVMENDCAVILTDAEEAEKAAEEAAWPAFYAANKARKKTELVNRIINDPEALNSLKKALG